MSALGRLRCSCPEQCVSCFPAPDAAYSIRRAAWIFPALCGFRGWHQDRRFRSVSGCFLGIGTLRFSQLIKPRLKLLGDPLVRFGFGFEASDFLKPPIGPSGPNIPIMSSPVAYLKHGSLRVHGCRLFCSCGPLVPVGRVLLARPGPRAFVYWPRRIFSGRP